MDGQPPAWHLTQWWPSLPYAWAQSQGIQPTMMVPQRHGCPFWHCAGRCPDANTLAHINRIDLGRCEPVNG
jgi:hypothetical protein